MGSRLSLDKLPSLEGYTPLFKCPLHSDKTLQSYKQHLWYFCNFIELTTEEIVIKYTSDNIKEAIRLQRIVEDYVLFLQAKISNGEITAGTAHSMIPSVKLFCEMNDIILNWRKINKLLPYGNGNAADEAYTREQIKKMLEYSDLRAKISILFMASSGMRLGKNTGHNVGKDLASLGWHNICNTFIRSYEIMIYLVSI